MIKYQTIAVWSGWHFCRYYKCQQTKNDCGISKV